MAGVSGGGWGVIIAPLLVMLGGWEVRERHQTSLLVIDAGSKMLLPEVLLTASRLSHRLYGFPLPLFFSPPQLLGRSTFMPICHEGFNVAYLWLTALSFAVYNRSCRCAFNSRSRRRRLFLPHKRPVPLATALLIVVGHLHLDPGRYLRQQIPRHDGSERLGND